MQIIQTPPPKLDSADPKVNFTKIQQYLQNTIESIDFILAKYAGNFKSVSTSSNDVNDKINDLKSQITALDRAITDLKNEQNTTDTDITSLKSSVSSINQEIISIKSTLADHEDRIKKLENPGGGS